MIEKLKENIIRDISNQLDKLLTGISESESKLNSIKNDILSKSEEYLKINKEVEESRKELIETRTVTRKELDTLKKEKVSIKELRVKTDKKVAEANGEIEKLDGIVERLEEDRISTEKSIKSMDTMKAMKDSLEKEVVSLNSKTRELKEDNAITESAIIGAKAMVDEELDSKRKELESIRKDIAKEKEIVLPKLEELQEREKKITEKEKSLVVIEQRWKKLYGDKGAGFKI